MLTVLVSFVSSIMRKHKKSRIIRILDNITLQFKITDIMIGSIRVNNVKATKKILVNIVYLERVPSEFPITTKEMPTQVDKL